MSAYLGGLIVDTTPDSRRCPKVLIQADPRIGTLRPAWLADDQSWSDQLQALKLDDDVRWIERHWDMAGGAGSAVDTSWITYEKIANSPLIPIGLVVAAAVLIFAPLMLWVR